MAKKQTGLTLVELMVTLAVAIILIAVGLPLFSGVADNNRMTAQVNALSSALQLARSEAVKTGDRVNVCSKQYDVANDPSDDFFCGDETHWDNGWIVYRGAVVAPGNEVAAGARVRHWSQDRDALNINSLVESISFIGSGARDDFDTSTDDRVWVLQAAGCTTDEPLQRRITVRPVGQVLVVRELCP